ncbi:MAG: hypothetical protein AAF485_19225 [Chloroflexota bacterium]
MDLVIPALTAYLVQLPVILVWIGGGVLCIMYWQRYPKVALVTLIAIIGFLITSFVNTYLSISLPMLMHREGWSASQIGPLLAAQGVVSSLISAVLWGLLIAAVFGWRNQADSDSSPDVDSVSTN